MLRFAEQDRRRRSVIARAFTRRCDLPAGSPPKKPGVAFLRRLKDLNPSLEMIWHPVRQRWCCYRLTEPGTTPCGDSLALVRLCEDDQKNYREPGEWLIHWIQDNDYCRKYGTATYERAGTLLDDDLLNREYEADRAKARGQDHLTDEFSKDAGWCCRGRTSFSGFGEKVDNRRKPKRQVV